LEPRKLNKGEVAAGHAAAVNPESRLNRYGLDVQEPMATTDSPVMIEECFPVWQLYEPLLETH
jgi:hypothetical protein